MKVTQKAYDKIKEMAEYHQQEAQELTDESARLFADAGESFNTYKGLSELLESLEILTDEDTT